MESLYRKYRPQTFATMVGQKHIVSTLHNALAEGRTAHAYLFSGPRGTGKTTTARLLAKALLCEGGPTPEPDGTCEQCQEIAAGMHPDVYELDAASRTGVDNVREEIINRVAFAPSRGRYKVYIIDEVHMLTNQAFNALLKTLEEPPEHVVFVLCTTDPQRMPETILSRCQRLEFHRIQLEDIEERLRFVCQSEGFTYEDAALHLVARHARGGLRDALGTLETLSVHGSGNVTLAAAQDVLGEMGDDVLAAMVRGIASRDVAACFAQVADLAERGVDLVQFTRDLTRYVRNVYVAAVAGPKALPDRSDAEKIAQMAADLGGADRLAHMLDVLGRLESELRMSLDQRLSLEVALTRMARPASDLTLESLAARVAQLERLVRDLRANGLGAAPEAAGAGVAYGQQGAFAQAGGVGGGAPGTAYGRQAVASAQRPDAADPGASPVAAPGQPQQAVAAPGPSAGGQAAYGRPAATVPQGFTAQSAPQVSGASGSAAATLQSALDPATSQQMWGRMVEAAVKTSGSLGALLRTADGMLSADGTLTIVNRGSAFAGQMMSRPETLRTFAQVGAQVYGRAVRVVIAGPGAAAGQPAASVAPAVPAAYAAPQQTYAHPPVAQHAVPASRPVNTQPTATPVQASQPAAASPAASAPRPISAAAIAAAAAAAVNGSVPASAVPAAFGASSVLAAPAAPPSAGPAAPATPSPAAGQPAYAAPWEGSAPAPADPSYDAVPDDVYDSYDEALDEEPVPSPEAAAVEALSGASQQPVSSAPAATAPAGPVPAAVAPEAPASAPVAPQTPAPTAQLGFDQACAELSELLAAGFGAPVPVRIEK